MDLILARCGADPTLFGDISSLSAHDQARLLDPEPAAECWLAEPLADGRMAIGRRVGVRCTWWLAPADLFLQPPHALWLEPALFETDGDGRLPHTLDVEALWQDRDPDVLRRTLAPLVQAVRSGVSVEHPSADAQTSLELGVLLAWILGPDPERLQGRARFSMAIGHPTRVAHVSIRPGASASDAEVTDPVALWVQSYLEPHTRPGISSAFVRSRSTLDHGIDLARQLGARGSLDDLSDVLVQHTLDHTDPAPWIALTRRPAVVREHAVLSLLERVHDFDPSSELIAALDAIYPRGAALTPWCSALLEWLRRTSEPEALIEALQTALLEWPASGATAVRASMWTEAVRILVTRGRPDLARRAVIGPLGAALVADNSGRALAAMWASLPPDERAAATPPLVASLARAADGDAAMAQLFLHVRSYDQEVAALIDAWFAQRGAMAVRRVDRLRAAVWDTPSRAAWWIRAVEHAEEAALLPLLEDAGPTAPCWVEFEAALGIGRTALERVHHLVDLADGRMALVPVARGLLPEALRDAQFPDTRLAQVAGTILAVPGASVVWAWLAAAAAPPGAYPDDLIDGTVVDLCRTPPRGSDRTLSLQIAERLATAAQWTPLDHARWVVRFALAPSPRDFNDSMAERLLHAMAGRPDADVHLAALVTEMLALDASHPALQSLVLRWLPGVWVSPSPGFLAAVDRDRVPPSLAAAWGALAHR